MAETPAKRRKVVVRRRPLNDLSFEDFAPDGDVVFIVKDETRVRVYSDVMKLASSVFAVMLGPNFKEGRALAEASTTPVEIALPEDEPESFGWICRALHCQASTKLWTPDTTQLVSVWMLIDKYNMKDGMQISLEYWINPQVEGERSIGELWLLAQISLGVQDASSFAIATEKLILHMKSSFVQMAAADESHKPIIPGRLLYKLAATLQEARDSAMARLLRLLYSDLPEGFQDCKSGTSEYFQKLRHAFQELSVPPDFPDTTASLKAVSSVNSSVINWVGLGACPCSEDECPVSYDQYRAIRANVAILEKLETAPADGLCFYCFDGAECPNHKE